MAEFRIAQIGNRVTMARMDSHKNIVCGVDFSPHSRWALGEALRLARLRDRKLKVVHALALSSVEQNQEDYDLPFDKILEGYDRELRRFLAQSVADLSLKEGDLDVTTQVAVGSPNTVVLSVVEESDAGLLVLGSRGLTANEHCLGVHASRCLESARVPVLLVRENTSGPFKRVLACSALDEVSRGIVRTAAEVAADEQATLDVVHVMEPPWMADDSLLRIWKHRANDSPEFREKYLERWKARLEVFVSDSVAPITPDLNNHILTAPDPGRALIQFVRDEGIGLVVLGRHGGRDLMRFFLGSTATRMVRSADASLLVVPPQKPE